MTCAAPLPLPTLAALWSGDLDDAAAEAAELHLLGCDACAARSDRLGALVAGLRGLVPPVISHAHRDRLAGAGLRLHHTPVAAGVVADAHFARDVDLLIHVLRAELAGAERVDVELTAADGTPFVVLEHVPFDAAAGEVLIACQRHYMYAYPPDPVFHVHAVRGSDRREVGAYQVHHTIDLDPPGPADPV